MQTKQNDMSRYFKIFLLYFQLGFEYKSLSVVWFLTSLAIPALMLVFWSGATASQGGTILGWTYANFATYYLFIALAGSLFIAHIENAVAHDDIKNGELASYLLKPVPYFSLSLLSELPWRFIQGVFSVLSIVVIAFFIQNIIQITSSPIIFLLAVIMAILAFCISFTFKMCLGLLAFWFTDIGGIMELSDIVLSLCSGIVIPLIFLPAGLKLILNILPFSYMVYYPVIGFLGKLDIVSELVIIGIQIIWIILFLLLYKILWLAGRKKFMAVGG